MRILGIDYGSKRTGLAVTDPLQIIVTALTVVDTKDLYDFLSKYIPTEQVEKIVWGNPVHPDGQDLPFAGEMRNLHKKLKQTFPDLHIEWVDESFTSVKAREIIMNSGYSKKKRREKALVDRVSAVVILQEYLGHI